MEKMNIYAEALTLNHTVKAHKNATINGGQIGVDNFAKWDVAVSAAREAFYTYQKECIDRSIDHAVKANTTNAYNALQAILDLIGEVNGRKLIKSEEMLVAVSRHAIKEKEELIGKAALVNSQLKNYRIERDNVHTGMNEDYIASLEENIAAKEAELKLLKTQPDSAKKTKTRQLDSVFRYKLETTLAEFIKAQSAKSWAELEAEEEARRAERKAAAKARRAAKKAAEKAQAKAEA